MLVSLVARRYLRQGPGIGSGLVALAQLGAVVGQREQDLLVPWQLAQQSLQLYNRFPWFARIVQGDRVDKAVPAAHGFQGGRLLEVVQGLLRIAGAGFQ